jgi:hypothetical protein
MFRAALQIAQRGTGTALPEFCTNPCFQPSLRNSSFAFTVENVFACAFHKEMVSLKTLNPSNNVH